MRVQGQERADASIRQKHEDDANGSWHCPVAAPVAAPITEADQELYRILNSGVDNRPPSGPGNHQTEGQLI